MDLTVKCKAIHILTSPNPHVLSPPTTLRPAPCFLIPHLILPKLTQKCNICHFSSSLTALPSVATFLFKCQLLEVKTQTHVVFARPLYFRSMYVFCHVKLFLYIENVDRGCKDTWVKTVPLTMLSHLFLNSNRTVSISLSKEYLTFKTCIMTWQSDLVLLWKHGQIIIFIIL